MGKTIEPKVVRIGPFDYEIRWMDRVEEEDSKAFGLHNGNLQVIRLARPNKRQRVAATFLHEVLHACDLVYGPCADAEKKVFEEDLVTAHGLGFSAFVRDNPEAVRWYLALLLERPGESYG